jgi:hypothetical protein
VSLAIITNNSQLIIAFLAALAMFSAVVVVGWPYLAGDAHQPHAAISANANASVPANAPSWNRRRSRRRCASNRRNSSRTSSTAST